MKKILILGAVSLLLCGCEAKEKEQEGNQMISCSDMKELLNSDDKAMLIDVRTKAEYEEGHLDNAINIEYRELIDSLNKVDRDTPIVVYCKTGNRSDLSYNELVDYGYKNVYDLGSINNCK